MKQLTRDSSLDLVRICATFFVVSVHYFRNIGFYDEPVIGNYMLFLITVRSLFMVCVPLFLILTGYLMSKKELSKHFYRGIQKTLIIYVLASLACVIYDNIMVPHTHNYKTIIGGILGFGAAPYSWYIEMYIGVFLLIPFLNLIYWNLKGKRQKQLLLITLLFLTALPSVLNIYNFQIRSWWLRPATSTHYNELIPNCWTTLYPFTYYFIGSYLREYGLKLSKKKSLLFLVLTIIFSGVFCFYRSYESTFVSGPFQNWGSLSNVIIAVLIFHILSSLKKVNNCPLQIRWFLKKSSDLSLGAYLVSSSFDNLFYTHVFGNVSQMTYQFKYYFIIVPAVFCCSMILSLVLNIIYKLMMRFTSHFTQKAKLTL